MTRSWRISPSLMVLSILLVLTATLRLVNLTGAPARVDDEGTYVAQAYAMTRWGELAHYTYWYDHPPVGWLQLAAWSLLAGPDAGSNAVASARYLMVIVSVLTAALLWALSRRLRLSTWASGGAVALFALSPLAIALGRQVYLDNIAVTWMLAAFVLMCSPQRRLSAMFGAAVCFGVAILTKETTVLLVPAGAWLVWTRTAHETRRYALAVFASVVAVVLISYPLLAAVRGELLPGPGHVSLLDGLRFQLWQRDPGGTILDPYSLKRHTLGGWVHLDPVLTLLAVPAAVAGLFVQRLRPIAIGLVVLIAVVARPGYLPVPLIMTALPLIALLIAGCTEVAIRHLAKVAESDAAPARHHLPGRGGAMAAASLAAVGVLLVSFTLTLWGPTLMDLTDDEQDAPMQQAQAWIKDNVPVSDRLIVDDALWVDLVREGRDRRNVVWAYKVDTDQEVQNWSPLGWRNYDWVVSTPSMRANMPKQGVLTDAVQASQPAAVFGSGGDRIEMLHVASKRVDDNPRSSSVGHQLANRLADTADPRALTELQSAPVDRRLLATLALAAANEHVLLTDIPAIAGEDSAGTPRREMVLAAAGASADRLTALFTSQVGPFAPESVTHTPMGIRVRFPLRSSEIGLAAASASTRTGDAHLRVADLRPNPELERLDLVRVDGTAAGSAGLTPGLADYRAVPAGTYLATTHTQDSPPIIRGVITMNPGASYTLTVFSGATPDEIVAQFVPDGGNTNHDDNSGTLRLMAAAHAGPVGLAVTADDTNQRIVLADHVGYGLVTGYAPLPAGNYTATVTTEAGQSEQPIQIRSDRSSTVLLTDGADGPVLETVPDLTGDTTPLDPPTLAIPVAGTAAATPAATASASAADVPSAGPDRWSIPVVLAVGILLGAVGALAAARMTKRSR
jgi:hypothetical protein